MHPLFPSLSRPLNYPSILSLSRGPFRSATISTEGVCTHTVYCTTDVTLLTSHVELTRARYPCISRDEDNAPFHRSFSPFFLLSCVLTDISMFVNECLRWEAITINRDVYCPLGSLLKKADLIFKNMIKLCPIHEKIYGINLYISYINYTIKIVLWQYCKLVDDKFYTSFDIHWKKLQTHILILNLFELELN